MRKSNSSPVKHTEKTHTGNSPFFRKAIIQPKLSINTPGDAYEQEADAMADKVMGMQMPAAQDTFFKPAAPSIQRKCKGCEDEDKLSKVSVHASIVKTTTDPNHIVYDKNKLLTKDDFQATPDSKSKYSGLTSSGFGYKLAGEGKDGETTINLSIEPAFEKNKSWIKKEAKDNKSLLDHEQLHFDITAVQACCFSSQVSNFSFTDKFNNEISQLYNTNNSELKKRQNRYDTETTHGITEDKQSEWQKSIEGEINNSSCYK